VTKSKIPAVDEVIIMEPDFCFFIKGTVSLQNKKIPSILTSMHSFHSVKLMSSIKAVGPFIPAFAQSTSIVSQSFFIFSKSFFTALSSRTSVCDFFHSLGQLSSCSLLLSAIQTLSPLTSKGFGHSLAYARCTRSN